MSRKVDELGRVSIPKHVRVELGFEARTPVSFRVEDNRLIVTKAHDTCVLCNSDENLTSVGDKFICTDCRAKLTK